MRRNRTPNLSRRMQQALEGTLGSIDRAKHEPAEGFVEPAPAILPDPTSDGDTDRAGGWQGGLTDEQEAELARLLAPLPPEEAEVRIASAIINLLPLRPIPWPLVIRLARMGKGVRGK